MGVEYFLVKEETKEIFDLGKGNWFSVFNTNTEKGRITYQFKNYVDLYHSFLSEVALSFQESTPIGYFKELAKKIIIWARDLKIELRSASYFEDRKGYIQTGSRFDVNE